MKFKAARVAALNIIYKHILSCAFKYNKKKIRVFIKYTYMNELNIY